MTPDVPRDAAAQLAAGRELGGRAADFVGVNVTVTDRQPATAIAARVREYVDAGATSVALHAVGDDSYPLPEFARVIGAEVREALGW